MRVANANSALYPSGNEWGIPSLMSEPEPDRIVAPVVRWGSVSRRTQHGGTWCLYVDDYRFGPWESLAERIAATASAACIEPNYTCHEWTPRAEVLWGVYRKRRVARELLELGVPVFVDVCMPAEHFDLALLGVPRGWRAYATRGFDARAEEVAGEYALAAEHAGTEPLVLVYGGGPRVAAVVRQLPGAVHVKAPRNVSEVAA